VSDSPDNLQRLISFAEVQLGTQRANELRSDIEQVAADLKELSAAAVEFDDEP
jgi:hypothetical protein